MGIIAEKHGASVKSFLDKFPNGCAPRTAEFITIVELVTTAEFITIVELVTTAEFITMDGFITL
jgi:hypothetical protein